MIGSDGVLRSLRQIAPSLAFTARGTRFMKHLHSRAALQIDDEESLRGKKPGRPAGRSALLLRVLAALLTAALLGAIVLYSQRPGRRRPPPDFEPL